MAVDESLPPDPAATPPPDDGGSLADHEREFASTRQDSRTESTTPPAESPEPEQQADTTPGEERDDKGRFLPRRGRHHTAKDAATVADAPRIRELSDKLRAAEAERDALKAQQVRPRTADAGAAVGHPSPPPAAPPPPNPKPTVEQFQSYDEFVEAVTDWKVEQALAAADVKRAETERQRQLEAETARLRSSWNTRVTAAMQKYPDFEDVALKRDTAIPPGSLIDAWVLEHKTGADVLYHLQSHPDELHALLSQPVIDQAETLALLSQRFNGSSPRSATVATGSAPALVSPAPRPPNPVRTSPQHASDEPPGDDASLADHERYYPVRHARA